MKKMFVFLAIVCLLMAPASPVLSQEYQGPTGSPLLFNEMPDLSWQEIDGGAMLVINADGKTYYILNRQQTVFPAGTDSGKKKSSDGKWEVYTLLPGADPQTGWQVVTTDMVGNNPASNQLKKSQAEQQELPPGVIPEGMGQKASPHSIMTGFPTGYATVTPEIEQQMKPLAKVCKDSDVFCILEGQASRLSYGSCYVDMNEGYIAPPSGHNSAEHPNAQLIRGDRQCNEYLAQARAMNTAKKLVQMGVPRERVFWLTHASWGIRPGTNYENQAVVAFVISRSSINVEAGGPVISSNAPPVAECPTCNNDSPAPIINIHGDCFVASRQNNNGRWEVTVICFKSNTQEQQTKQSEQDKEKDGCWAWALAGGAAGAGAGWGVSQLDAEGGEGAGNAGDGGDASVCGDNPLGCIIGGAVFGAGSAYIGCKIQQHKERNK